MQPMLSPYPANRRPRILQCVTHLALGGAERVALTLMTALREEFDFSVYAIRGLGDGEVGRDLERELSTLNIPLRAGPAVPMRFGGMISGGIGLKRAVDFFGPDLIHLHTEIPEASYATMTVLRPARRAIPLVRTIHNAVIWDFWRSLGRWCDRRMPETFAAGVSQGAVDAFLKLRRESGAGDPPIPPRVIYNGVPPVNYSARRPRSPTDPVRIVFGGRFEPQKGTDLLPQILAQVRMPRDRRVHLVLFGSGLHEILLRSLGSQPPPNWTIEVCRPVSDFRMRLADFDLAIVPSRFEGIALVAIEAFLANLPVIATDAAGLREALPPEYPWRARAGDVESFAAMLTEALANPNRWEEIAGMGRAFARKRFDVSPMAGGYRALYLRALESHTSASRPAREVGVPSSP